MPFAWAECEWCHSKRRSYFNKEQHERLLRGEPCYHPCVFCLVATPWSWIEPRAPGQAGSPEVPLRPPAVLLIDDDEQILSVLSRALGGKDFFVDAADSAREALIKIVNENFDIVISDVHMPGFDGKKLFHFIQEYLPEYRKRVMFLTADTESSETRDFLQQSGCPFVFKPVDFGELLRAVEQRLAEADADTDTDTETPG